MSFGPLAVTIAAALVLIGLALLVNSGRAPRTGGEVPPNIAPYKTDDELETRRLDRTLVWALAVTAFVAVALPIYFVTESNRQAAFAEENHEKAIENGEHLYAVATEDNPHGFGCARCHGPAGVGGVAPWTDERTGAPVSWLAPALNDVFYRYDRDEVLYWLNFGRQGAPMPAWGIPGGGPANEQELDEILDYLESIQLPQEEVLARADDEVAAELARLDQAVPQLQEEIAIQDGIIAEVEAAPDNFATAAQALENACRALEADNAAVLIPADPNQELSFVACTPLPEGDPTGLDRDLDGLSDTTEETLTVIAADVAALAETLIPSDSRVVLAAGLVLDPDNAFSTTNAAGQPLPDLDAAEQYVVTLTNEVTNLRIQVVSQDRLLTAATTTRAALERNLVEERWDPHLDAVADEVFGGDLAAAERAYGLYSANCGRCHTAGYSAGPGFTLEPGSGGLGPSLRDGRSVVQFPEFDDQLDFIINGSQDGVGYGVNGIGRGWMPGFGAQLTLEDLELIVLYERGL